MTDAIMSFDVETHAFANLKVVGANAYLNHPDTDVALFAYHLIGDPGEPKIWFMGEPPPADLVAHVQNGGMLSGWNCLSFDATAWEVILVPRFGFPVVGRDKWLDTMHQAAAANLPRSLDGCAKAVGAPYQADLKDNNILRRITNKALTPVIQGDDLAWLTNRCVQDTKMEEETLKRLPPWFTMPPWDRMREIDRLINDRGVLMDAELVRGLEKAATEETHRIDKQMNALTEGFVSSVSKIEKLKIWLMREGIELPLKTAKKSEEDTFDDDDNEADARGKVKEPEKISYRLRKSDIADIIVKPDTPDHCRQALEWRAEAAKASVKKLKRMLESAGPDGRLRGALILGGAQATFRWSGTIWQPHNMVRDTIANDDDVEELTGINPKKDPVKFERASELALLTAINTGRSGDRALMEAAYMVTRRDAQNRVRVEGVLPFVSRMQRRTIAAPEGFRFLNGDYSQIEARIPMWLAQQVDKLEVFRRGEDIYRAQAAPTFNKLPHELTKTERQIGKVQTLFLGFAGGVGAFIPAAMNYGLRISREDGIPIVNSFRQDNTQLVDYWDANLLAAVNAVGSPGSTFYVGPTNLIAWCMTDNCLYCRLPSGRMLRYWAPTLEKAYWPDGGPKANPDLVVNHIKGRAVMRRTLWRGLSMENCMAGDAEVLTNSGWKFIIQVTDTDLLWDGENWVEHDGVVHQGNRPTVNFGGVRMTSDHKVLIDADWTRNIDTTHGDATSSYERHYGSSIPVFNGREISGDGRSQSRMAYPVCLWQYQANDSAYVSKRRRFFLWLQNVRMEICKQQNGERDTRDVSTSGVCCMALYAGPVSVAYAPSMEELWRTGYNGVRKMATIFREFLGRYGFNIPNRFEPRQVGQQSRILSPKLFVDTERFTEQKQTQQCFYRDPLGSYYGVRRRATIGYRSDDAFIPVGSKMSAGTAVRTAEFSEPVYDILNAGPNHRFTVRGNDKRPFIVSNCTQAIAADILGTALVNMHDASLPVVIHVHDSVTAEVPKSQAERLMPQFEQAMLSQPAWTAGLPLAVSTDISTRFG